MLSPKTQTAGSNVKPGSEKAPGKMPEKFNELDKSVGNMGQKTAREVDKRVGKLSGAGIDVAHTRSDLSGNLRKPAVNSEKTVATKHHQGEASW